MKIKIFRLHIKNKIRIRAGDSYYIQNPIRISGTKSDLKRKAYLFYTSIRYKINRLAKFPQKR